MLLIFLSSNASSRLTGSFGSPRPFSLGTWSARGWRWPIGASGMAGRLPVVVDVLPLLVVWAIAAGPPTATSRAIEMINFRILLLRRFLIPVRIRRSWLRRIDMNVTAIVDHTIACFGLRFTLQSKRNCLRQVVRAERGLAVAAGNIEHVIRLA